MGMVMVRCPISGNEIPTGIETETAVLELLPKVETAVHCPECGEKHFWTIEHAYVARERSRRLSPASS